MWVEDYLEGEKLRLLGKAVGVIKNEAISKFVCEILQDVPARFWEMPASTTGKYHPACTIRKHGLIVHTKRVLWMAMNLIRGWKLEEKADIIKASCILHDVDKTGKGYGGTYKDYENHPVTAGIRIAKKDLDLYEAAEIASCVKFHMGPWTPAKIRKPLTEYTLPELLVYTADYSAAIKELKTQVDGV